MIVYRKYIPNLWPSSALGGRLCLCQTLHTYIAQTDSFRSDLVNAWSWLILQLIICRMLTVLYFCVDPMLLAIQLFCTCFDTLVIAPPPFPILLCCTCCDTLVISVLLFNFVALDMMLPYRSSNDFVPIHQIQSKFCPLLYVQLWDLTFKNGHLTSHLMTELGKMKNLFKSSLAI